jgi:hypothetical protein
MNPESVEIDPLIDMGVAFEVNARFQRIANRTTLKT